MFTVVLTSYGNSIKSTRVMIDGVMLLTDYISSIASLSSLDSYTPMLDEDACGNIKDSIGNVRISDDSSSAYSAKSIIFYINDAGAKRPVAGYSQNAPIVKKESGPLSLFLSLDFSAFTGGFLFSSIHAGLPTASHNSDGIVHIEDPDITADDSYSVYSKAQADSLLSGKVPTSRKINNKALTSDITLTASDVGALPSSTVIPTVNDKTVTIKKNNADTGDSFTLNQSTDKTINLSLHTVATSGSYNDLFDKPSIPTVNNASLTIAKGGTDDTASKSFTANASSNVEIHLGLGAAADKGVDSSIAASSTSTALPTSQAVASFVEGKGYLTSYTETDPTVPSWAKAESKPSYTLDEVQDGTSRKLSNYELKSNLKEGAYVDVDETTMTSTSTNLPTSKAVASYISGQNFATVSQIPTVNDTSITIKKNASDTGDSFTTNTDTAKTINLSLHAVATSGSYNDLSDTPNIPTINNATLTIQRNGASVNTFTANASEDVTANIEVPVLGVQRNGTDLTPDTTTKKVNVEVPVLGVQRNGSDLTPDTNKKVNVAVPVLGVQVNGTDLTPDTTTKKVNVQIKTVNSKTITGSGNIDLTASDVGALPSSTVIPTVNNNTVIIKKNSSDTGDSFTLNQSTDKTINLSLHTVATSGSYSDLSDKPDIPTVNDATLTIKKDENDEGETFTANASTDVTVNLGLSAVATSGAYSDLSGKPTIPTVNNSTITIKANIDDTGDTFTTNAASNKTINLGLSSAAVSGSYNDLTDKPTIPTVNNASLTINKGGTNDTATKTFTANASSNVTINLGLGAAADKGVDTSIGSSASSNLPTTDAVKGYVGTGALTISKGGTDDTSSKTFSANASSNMTISLGLGAAADKAVDSSISAASTSTKLPTSQAVASFVEGKGYLTSHQSLAGVVASAQYNSTTQKIEFYNDAGTKLNTDIDASDFIKDGMVDNASVSGSNLVITFNTDAGKEDIEIPISDIFDASNYYTKNDIDTGDYENVIDGVQVNGSDLTPDTTTKKVNVQIKTLHSKALTGTGNVTLTASDVGAIAKLSSTTDNTIVRFDGASSAVQGSAVTIDDSGNIIPATDNASNLGSTGSGGKKWADVYAAHFHGNLDGNATSATTAGSATTATSATTAGSATTAEGLSNSSKTISLTSNEWVSNTYVKASGFKVGTDTGFLKADGSVDNSTYLTQHQDISGKQDVLTAGDGIAIDSTDTIRATGIPFGICSNTSTATAFTVTVPGIDRLEDGVCCIVKNGVITSAAGFTINVNGLGAKPVYSNMAAATAETTIFNINYTMLFVYDSTRVTNGCWVCYRGYYSDKNDNTIGYLLRSNYSTLALSDATGRYRLYFTSADRQKFVPSTTSTTSNATSSRAVNQRAIDPFGIIVYNSTNATYAAGDYPPKGTLWTQYTITLGYSFNRTGASLALTSKAPIFIKCAPQDDGSAKIDSTTPYVQALPTTNDGKIYIFLGLAYHDTEATTATVELFQDHPVYYHNGGGIRLWTGHDTVPTSRTINGKALTSNISLTASDVGALPSSTTIPTVNDATLKIQRNGTDVATFTANASTGATANIEVPVLGIQRNGSDITPDTTTKKVNVEVPVLGVQRNGTDITPDTTTKKVNVEVPVLGVQRNGSDLTPDTTTKKVNVEVPVLGVQRNGSDLTPDTNKKVNVAVPVLGVQVNGTDLTPDTTTKKVNVQIKTVNSKTITGSGNVDLTASDVGALPSSTTIPTVNNKTVTIKKNSSDTGDSFTLNQSTDKTITLGLGSAADKTATTSMSATASDSNILTELGVKNFVEGKGYLTSYTETDPTVPSWAKAESKPSYTLDEVLDGTTRKLSDYVPTTRTVNSKALSSNIVLTLDDVADGTSREIPTVNNGTLTIKKDGTTQGTFTANQSGNTEVDLHIPPDLNSAELVGGMVRYDVSGSGNMTIKNTYGLFPYAQGTQTTLPAGTYIVRLRLRSSTSSYSVTVNFGSSYTVSTTNGIIDDVRSVTLSSAAGFSASITQVNSGTYLRVVIYEPDSVISSGTVGAAAVTNDYNDLDNIPNGTLVIQKNGSNVASFSASADSNVTANITVPTNTNQLTNGAGFITSSALSDYVTTNTTQTVTGTKTFNDLSVVGDLELTYSDSDGTNDYSIRLGYDDNGGTALYPSDDNCCGIGKNGNAFCQICSYSIYFPNSGYLYGDSGVLRANLSLVPDDDSSYNLGSSSYLWNYIYSCNYKFDSVNTTASTTTNPYLTSINSDTTDYVNGIASFGNFLPYSDSDYYLGSASFQWAAVYANTFYGYLDGIACSADMLSVSRNLEGVKFDGQIGVTHYAYCETAEGDSPKVVVIPNFELVTGARVLVKFANRNSASSPTLRVDAVSGTAGTAKAIKYSGTSAVTSSIYYRWMAGDVVEFVYDGTNWIWVGFREYAYYSNYADYAKYGLGVYGSSSTTIYPLVFANSCNSSDSSASTKTFYTAKGTSNTNYIRYQPSSYTLYVGNIETSSIQTNSFSIMHGSSYDSLDEYIEYVIGYTSETIAYASNANSADSADTVTVRQSSSTTFLPVVFTGSWASSTPASQNLYTDSSSTSALSYCPNSNTLYVQYVGNSSNHIPYAYINNLYIGTNGTALSTYIAGITVTKATNATKIVNSSDTALLTASTSSVTVTADLLPTNNTYSLGSTAAKWKTAYFTGGHASRYICVDNTGTEPTIRPDTDNYGYLGTSQFRWYRAYISNLYADNINGGSIAVEQNSTADTYYYISSLGGSTSSSSYYPKTGRISRYLAASSSYEYTDLKNLVASIIAGDATTSGSINKSYGAGVGAVRVFALNSSAAWSKLGSASKYCLAGSICKAADLKTTASDSSCIIRNDSSTHVNNTAYSGTWRILHCIGGISSGNTVIAVCVRIA